MSAPNQSLPNVTHVCREILLQFPDPDKAEAKKVLALTRARYAQLGGDPKDVHPNKVHQVRSILRKEFDGPITRALLERLQKERVGATSRVATRRPTQPAARAVPTMAGPPPNRQFTVEELRRAKAFVTEAGGTDRTHKLLGLLEELTG